MNTKNFIFLRGIAIVLVLLFHLGIKFFKFGFIGVDIFFVLSSFLITKSISERNYKLNNYYYYLEKRFFRIFPPLVAVITLSIIFSYLLLYPDSLILFSKSIIYTFFGFADIFFLNNINYFAPFAYHIPSTHFWSLGVEIKFYIIAPLILYRTNKKILYIFVLLSLLSYFIFYDFNNSFFLFLLKLPHFIIGSLLYYLTNRDSILFKFSNSNIINIFFFLIFPCCFAIFNVLNYNIHLASLISILISIVLILSSNSKIYKFFFCNFLFNYFGKLSYSIYLVHWPIIVFYTLIQRGAINEIPYFNKLEIVILICLIIFFSHIIYIFFEKRFIDNQFKNLSSIYLQFLIMFILIFSITVIYKNGMWERLNIQTKKFYINYKNFDLETEKQKREVNENARTKFLNTANKNILILGDSYSRDIYSSLLISGFEKFSKKNIDVKLYDHFSQYCFESLINNEKFNKEIYIKFKCKELIEQINDDDNFKHAHVIIISYRFGAFSKENWRENILSLKNIKNNEIFKNKEVIVLSRRIEFYHFLHTEVMTQILLYKTSNLFPFIKKKKLENILGKNYAKDEIERVNELLKESLSDSDVIYFDFTKLQKDKDEDLLQFNDKGQSLYLDSVSHFTMAGRLYFGNLILQSNLFTNLINK